MLRTFGKMFEPDAREALDTALKQYAARLGEVRDLQVLGGVLAEHSSGILTAWVGAQVQRELASAWQQLERELATTDYQHLADLMAAVILSPPRGIDLDKCVRRARRRAKKRLADAGVDADRLHSARKAAKRARYAAEATGRASRARQFEELQDVLGRHHDLVVAADWVTAAAFPDQLRAEVAELVERLRADAARTRARAVL